MLKISKSTYPLSYLFIILRYIHGNWKLGGAEKFNEKSILKAFSKRGLRSHLKTIFMTLERND